MRRRRQTRSRRAVKRNLVWIYNPIDINVPEVTLGASAGFQNLCQAADWQATFGLNFDRAVVMRIVGELVWEVSGTAATVGSGTDLFVAVIKMGANAYP